MAARIRAAHGLRTPDALLAATAIHIGATAIITDDPIFKRVEGIQSLILEDVV